LFEVNWERKYYSRFFRKSVVALLNSLIDRTENILDLKPVVVTAKCLVQELKDPIRNDNWYVDSSMKTELRETIFSLLGNTTGITHSQRFKSLRFGTRTFAAGNSRYFTLGMLGS
jgi:hypothetical protein